MLTFDHIEDILTALHFERETSGSMVFYHKHYDVANCYMKVHLHDKYFEYPAGLEANRETTKNFSQNENLVVFECVDALLSKGYKPEHIVLERAMPGGHGDTGGYCDIIVQDNDKHAYMLIECKTMTGADDDEFSKAWKEMLHNGGQLFNYYNSFRRAQYVCLYASDFVDGQLKRQYHLVPMRDNEEYLKSNKKLRGYEDMKKEGGTRDDFFRVWQDTYGKDYSTNGVFEPDIQAFHVGEKKMTLADLNPADSDEYAKGKYNQFASILRQYNISSHENAFDKLVNLFLAKIVDEVRNSHDLQFLWKGAAFDDDFSFQDRLQYLYKVGMEDYLNEQVTYVEEEQVNKAFRMQRNDPDAIRDTILDFFRQLKFYSNSDFGFLDVHNEQLFRQNAVVLRAMVQMLQDMRLKTEEQNQFLGDLFEGFLDQGVKQNEGQFFTPTPITRFMISALPLEQLIRDNTDIPRAIDFACGAGHFLNEYAAQIKPYIEQYKGKEALPDYYKQIFGIEKEYRLSKVSKVASFMYGQDGIQIIYGDALVNHENRDIRPASFKVLVANPPYSVKGFLDTLTKEQRAEYTLSKEVDEKALATNNSIETFFVERAKHLLAPNGLVAIILPSSVLSNGNIYVKAREIVLKYFDIIAISEFGSGTFGKTGTNTVVLFLRRKQDKPEMVEVLQTRVDDWFKNNDKQDKRYQDMDALERYCALVGVSITDYKTLLQRQPSETLMASDRMQAYIKAFADSQKGKAILKKKITSSYTTEIQQQEYKVAELAYIIEQEKDKLLFFRLAENNGKRSPEDAALPVIVTKMPADKKEAKAFLGYEWSSRKGSEGIKYIGAATTDEDDELSANKGIHRIQTPLFDPNDLLNEGKLNTLIRHNFLGEPITVPESLQPFVSVYRLIDMLDFNKVEMDKAIKTTTDKKIEIVSKYPLVELGKDNNVTIIRGVSYSKDEQSLGETSNVVLTADNITLDGQFEIVKKIFVVESKQFPKEKQLHKGDCFMCFSSGSKQHIGKITYIEDDTQYYAGGFMGILRTNEDVVVSRYLFNVLNTSTMRDVIRQLSNGANINNLSNSLGNVKIPLPPIDIQQQIVSECATVDEEYNTSRMSIEEYKKKIAKVFADLEVISSQGGGKTE